VTADGEDVNPAASTSKFKDTMFFLKPPKVSLISNNVILYKGYINFSGFELLKELYDSTNKSLPIKVVIESLGGDPYAGMIIGRFIHKVGIDIEIKNVCLSACANFVFPASRLVYMRKESIVGFHQSMAISKKDGSIMTKEEKLNSYDKTPFDFHFTKNVVSPNQTDSNKEIALYYPEYLSNCGKRDMSLRPPVTKHMLDRLSQNMTITCDSYLEKEELDFYNAINVNVKLLKAGIDKFKKYQTKPNSTVQFFYYDKASLIALDIDNVIYPDDWDAAKNRNYKFFVEVKVSDWYDENKS
jgi:ATP-dependent protease ClpP protease subunit